MKNIQSLNLKGFVVKITFVFLSILSNNCYSQTSSASYKNQIETKKQQLESSNKKLSSYNSELVNLETLWKKKQMTYQQDLAVLLKDRDNLIGDMKTGAKCSQCGKYKSAFEKEGIDFEKHLGSVNGRAIPATTDELESFRKKYSELIAYKKVQIQNAEKGDKDLDYKRNQISDLEKSTASLSLEIQDLRSKMAEAFHKEEVAKYNNKTTTERTLEGFVKGMERQDAGGDGAAAGTYLREKLENRKSTTEPSPRSQIRRASTIKSLP